MRIQALVLASAAIVLATGAALAVSPRDSAGDYFVAAAANAGPHTVIMNGEARGHAGEPFMVANNGAAAAFVVGCEESCRSVHIQLREAGSPPLTATNSASNPHVATLQIPPNYARTLSNLEMQIAIGCDKSEGCYYRWALLGAENVPTLAQRGLRSAPSDAEWNAGAAPAAALRWVSRPSGDDLRFFYPVQAWSNGRSGSARLQCLVVADGTLRCRARNETPAGLGFGDAARRLSSMLRVETTDTAGQSTANRRVEIPVQFARSAH